MFVPLDIYPLTRGKGRYNMLVKSGVGFLRPKNLI